MAKHVDNSPILNGPYDEPRFHYATDVEGNLNYEDRRSGRRIFAPSTPQIPIGQPQQRSMFDINDLAAEYRDHLVNLLRDEIGRWRSAGYAGVTSRVTRDLLDHWFLNSERQPWQQLFFAQREAVETAIWLNEVAQQSNVGTHILNQLRLAQQTGGDEQSDWLPRIAFKMATGTGKTVVMACLILYHYLNRQNYRQDTRYADYFLAVAPGITIRDRLSVLYVDTQAETAVDARDYYRQRWLVPKQYEQALPGLNANLVVTNFHAFEPRMVGGNKRSPLDGKLNDAGKKVEVRENTNLVLKRVLGHFKPGRRLLIINDEAHHCYLPRAKGRDTEEEASATENERAAVWFSGIRACTQRWQVRSVYDLSATPYYLSGSGYPAYSLFPWIVTDFGLIEAIEAGLVKVPFLPIDDNTQAIGEPILRNLYEHCKDQLPRKGQRRSRADEKKEGKAKQELPPELPPTLNAALEAFFAHYKKYDAGLREQGERGRDLLSEPPVFIVVCSNTTVSKEVFKEIAGFETGAASSHTGVRPGRFDLFSNFDPVTLARRAKPPTLLIDSDALEHSGQVDEEFKRVFAPEIESFKREYRITHPDRSVGDITDADLLREVVNTVGKRGMLGSHVRCVVSVSMLTEGWDANTVTHIVGLRAFGSQLLCEQVAGRALRRRNYFIDRKTGKFPPEYAHIIGVPFKFFRGGATELPQPSDVKLLRALLERFEYEIKFPNVVGYRIEQPRGKLRADFSGTPNFRLDLTRTPLETKMGTAFSADTQQLSAVEALDMRDQEVIYWLAGRVLAALYRDDEGRPRLDRFGEMRDIVADWYAHKVQVIGQIEPRYKRLVRLHREADLIASIQLGIDAAAIEAAWEGERVTPILAHYNREGSTRYVFGHTSKEVFETKKSQVNYVVADTDSWEQIAAKTMEQMPEIEAYAKNAFLGFEIPYMDKHGRQRRYMPDFIARVRTPGDQRFNLIVEITGFAQDKAEKRYYLTERWLPSVNSQRERLGLLPWYFVEVTDIALVKHVLTDEISRIARRIDESAEREFWSAAQSSTLESVWGENDDKLFEAAQ